MPVERKTQEMFAICFVMDLMNLEPHKPLKKSFFELYVEIVPKFSRLFKFCSPRIFRVVRVGLGKAPALFLLGTLFGQRRESCLWSSLAKNDRE